MRALKTVLHCAGTLLHIDKQNSNELNNHHETKDQQHSYEYEAQFIIQAIKTNTLAKLTNSDAKQFENLIRDVFPDLCLHNKQFKNRELTKLIDSIHSVVREHNMILVEAQVRYILSSEYF